jgi:hypothetical protein
MAGPTDNETWIIEAGDDVVHKKADHGRSSLTPLEQLIYCLWVADYGMRNAGDLDAAIDLYPEFQSEGRRLAGVLSLPFTLATFSLTSDELATQYFERFERMCDEIKNA